jgi:hypothetical protein
VLLVAGSSEQKTKTGVSPEKESMKNSITKKRQSSARGMFASAVMFLALFSTNGTVASEPAQIVPVDETAYGETYAEHSASYWQWYLSEPLEGHPGIDSPEFNVKSGQRGKVWFLSGLLGTGTVNVTVPAGKALFIGLLNAEASTLEEPPFYGETEAEQRAAAVAVMDHLVEIAAAVDGQPVADIARYRVTSPQFSFEAPTPWIFGAVGGEGMAVGDGYYLLLRPMSQGSHTLHFTGFIRFTLAEDGFDAEISADVTINITVK